MTKWPKHEVIGIAVIGAVVVGGITLAALGVSHPMEGDEIHYEVDVFSGRGNPDWTSVSEGDDPILDLFTVEPNAGVPAALPGDLGFRGVILTSPDLPGGDALDAIRVVPSGYYLEFGDGTVRFIEDAAVWAPIRVQLEDLDSAFLDEIDGTHDG